MSAPQSAAVTFDVAVAGGGIAGFCAALAAARHGARTALIQDRPVLGGNASSEMRVWAVGAVAMGRNRYAAETGIVGEIDLENLYRNPEGNPYVFDCLLLDLAVREKNLTLYLNTTVLSAAVCDNTLTALTAYQMTTETTLTVSAACFIDATGDGRLGVLAGVPFSQGREGKARYGESLAPDKDEPFTLGSTLLLCKRDAGHSVPYRAPSFAYDLATMHALIHDGGKPLSLTTNGCDFWWLETGGQGDVIADGDAIRLDLQKLVYGTWNYLKNSGRFPSETWELDWVGSLPAKRESRRLHGAYTLTQNDILEHRTYPDTVAYGGWPIDTHPPGGIYSRREACDQRDAGLYGIPLRCLYAETPRNLFFAGRDISASHLAFASTRVMKTGGVMGQAAGTAAALCAKEKTVPGTLSAAQRQRLQQELRWDDQFWPEASDTREDTLPLTLTVSGSCAFENTVCDRTVQLSEPLWIQAPALPSVTRLFLFLKAPAKTPCRLTVLSGNGRRACDDLRELGTAEVILPAADDWVCFPLSFALPKTGNLFFRLSAAARIAIAVSDHPVCGMVGSLGGRTSLRLLNPCFRVDPVPDLFGPAALTNSFDRPTDRPNLWRSRPLSEESAWLETTLPTLPEGQVPELCALFDPDLNRDFNQLRPDYYGNGWDRMPLSLVRAFRVWADDGHSAPACVADVTENRTRRFVCRLPAGTVRVRLVITATWGDPCAGIFSLKVRAVSTPDTADIVGTALPTE